MSQVSVLRHILNHPMNRGRGLEAIGSYLRWQIGSRIVPGAVAVPFVNDAVLMMRPGMHGATQNIYCGLNDFADMSLLLHLLRPEDVFADVGANVGSYSVLASGAIGSRTVAFEPNPATFPDLMTNINANGLAGRVVAHRKGAGSKAGTLRFAASGPTTQVIANGNGGGHFFESPVVTLDESLAETAPTLIKIDVEGFEGDVLAGADRILKRPELLALIVENNGDCVEFGFGPDHVHNLLSSYGFEAASYTPRERRLTLLNGQKVTSMNSIYVRDVLAIEARLVSAPPFRVKGQVI